MGRSRRRTRTAAVPAPPQRGRVRASDRLDRPRRALALHLIGALVLAVLVLAGTVMLTGTLGPWIVLLAAASAALLLHRHTQSQLAGTQLADDDRILQTLAGGMLVLAVAFAAVAAIVLTLS